MAKPSFTLTSPNNSLSVLVYALLAFAGLIYITNISPNKTVDIVLGDYSDVWSTLLFISASVAVYATLSAPGRNDPDVSLLLEYMACITLCTLLGILDYLLLSYRPDGEFLTNTFGFTAIFIIGFAGRGIQIFVERRRLRQFRASQ